METPPRIEDLIGKKVIAHFDGKKHVCRLEGVDLNLCTLTLRTKKNFYFLPIDKVYLETPA